MFIGELGFVEVVDGGSQWEMKNERESIENGEREREGFYREKEIRKMKWKLPKMLSDCLSTV